MKQRHAHPSKTLSGVFGRTNRIQKSEQNGKWQTQKREAKRAQDRVAHSTVHKSKKSPKRENDRDSLSNIIVVYIDIFCYRPFCLERKFQERDRTI